MNCPACQTPYNPGNRFCGRCGAELPAAAAESEAAAPPAGSFPPYAPSPEFRPAADKPAAFALGEPAGFWIRALPFIIDYFIVVAIFILLWVVVLGQSIPAPTTWAELAADLADPNSEYNAQGFNRTALSWVLAIIYHAALVSLWATTLGKRVFGIYVVRTDGSRVGPGRAVARQAIKVLSEFTVGLLFLLVAFREDKRGLHDLICDTVVLRRDRQGG